MTALKEYQRLEAIATLRNSEFPEGVEVILALGEATLGVMDTKENALAHWSLAAIERINPGEMPAKYRPNGHSSEVIEVGEGESLFIEALAKISSHIIRKRKKPFKIRTVALPASVAAALIFCFVSAPSFIREYAADVVPDSYKPKVIEQLEARAGDAPKVEYTEVTLHEMLKQEDLSVSLFLIVKGKVPEK